MTIGVRPAVADGLATFALSRGAQLPTPPNLPPPPPPPPSSKFEFDYGLRRKGVDRMLTVVMEPRCRKPGAWAGSVGGKLGGKLYVDLCEDDGTFDAGVRRLADDIRYVSSRASAPGGVGAGGGGHPHHAGGQPPPLAHALSSADLPVNRHSLGVPLNTLDVDAVGRLLGALGLSKYAPRFAQESVGGADLVGLTDSELEELGVLALHRRRLLVKAAEFAHDGVPAHLLAPPPEPPLRRVRWVEARSARWDDALATLQAQLRERGIRRGQIVAVDAHNNGPDAEAIFSAFYSHDLPDRGELELTVHKTASSELGWGSFYDQAAAHARALPSAADLVAITASCTAGDGGVLYTLAYAGRADGALSPGMGALEWAEVRGDTWDGAAHALVEQLWRKGVRNGQIVAIDAHNNGPDAPAIFSAFYSHDLPDRGELSLSFSAQNTRDYGWATFYERAAAPLADLKSADNLVAITASCNTGGRGVLYVWTYKTEAS